MKKAKIKSISVDADTELLMMLAKKAGFNNSSLIRVAVDEYIKNNHPKIYEEYENMKEE